jgi:hypothetical protein
VLMSLCQRGQTSRAKRGEGLTWGHQTILALIPASPELLISNTEGAETEKEKKKTRHKNRQQREKQVGDTHRNRLPRAHWSNDSPASCACDKALIETHKHARPAILLEAAAGIL